MQLPQFGQHQVQNFISLTLVTGGVVVALICDYLKGTNEQLRELNVALRIQWSEERKRSDAERARFTQRIADQPAAAPTHSAMQPLTSPQPAAAEAQTAEPLTAEPLTNTGKLAPAPMEMAMVAVGPALPARTHAVPVRHPRASRSNGVPRRPISADAMAAMQRGATMAAPIRMAVSVAKVSSTAASTTNVPANVPASIELPMGVTPAASAEVKNAAQGDEVKTPSQVILGRKRNWSELLAQSTQNRPTNYAQQPTMGAQQPEIETAQPAMNMAQPAMSPSEAGGDGPVPAGFYDGYVLTRLVQSHKPVSGLVVSIGMSATHENGEPNLQAVRAMIQSLMGPEDFAAASAPDECLLIFPHEHGASAQRRLSEIAQRLWEFQLHTLGDASVLFSLGGLEVRGELIEDAIASASERMQDTRRSRMARSFDARPYQTAV